MRAKVVGVRELKARFGKYLRQVREEATLVVTYRGEPIAVLRPITSQTVGDAATLEKLAALGVVTHHSSGPLPPFRPVPSRGPPVADSVTEDRKDRF
jgi:prevent-host-death family protein